MLKVLHIVGKMDMAGLETFLMNFYRNIDRNQIQFGFIPLSAAKGYYDEEIVSLGGEVIYPPHRYDWKKPKEFKTWFDAFLCQSDFSILHSHNGGAASIVLPIAKKHGLVTIVHSHNTEMKKDKPFVNQIRRINQRLGFKYADMFFACSNEAGKYMFGNREFKIINNAIDISKFEYSESTRNRVRESIGLRNEEITIGTIGRLSPQKNPHMTISILNELKNNGIPFKFIWVGTGEMKDEIDRQIIENGLSEQIIMLGPRNDVNKILQAMDIFVFPSLFEGLGIVAIEAQAAGLPTICSDQVPKQAAVTELCSYVSVNDLDGWVKSIEFRIKNPVIRQLHTSKIRECGFDIHEEAKVLCTLYNQLASAWERK